MRLIIAIAVLITAGPALSSAQAPAPGAPAAADPELAAKAENVGGKLTTMLVDIDTNATAELKRKLRVLKAVQQEIAEETRLRMEIIEEFRRLQYGLQALGLRPAQDDGGKAQKLAALERMETIITASARETEDSRNAKVSLWAFRAALGAFNAANKGVFPENPAMELPAKYLQTIPYIRLPGHGAKTNSIEVVTGAGSREELFQKVNDSGGWLYVGDRTSPLRGTLIFNCNHKDYDGRAMFRY